MDVKAGLGIRVRAFAAGAGVWGGWVAENLLKLAEEAADDLTTEQVITLAIDANVQAMARWNETRGMASPVPTLIIIKVKIDCDTGSPVPHLELRHGLGTSAVVLVSTPYLSEIRVDGQGIDDEVSHQMIAIERTLGFLPRTQSHR